MGYQGRLSQVVECEEVGGVMGDCSGVLRRYQGLFGSACGCPSPVAGCKETTGTGDQGHLGGAAGVCTYWGYREKGLGELRGSLEGDLRGAPGRLGGSWGGSIAAHRVRRAPGRGAAPSPGPGRRDGPWRGSRAPRAAPGHGLRPPAGSALPGPARSGSCPRPPAPGNPCGQGNKESGGTQGHGRPSELGHAPRDPAEPLIPQTLLAS